MLGEKGDHFWDRPKHVHIALKENHLKNNNKDIIYFGFETKTERNSAARLATRSRKSDHVTHLLIELHWLPVEQGIEFKVLLLIHKAMQGFAPQCLRDLLEPFKSSQRSLRSASKLTLKSPSLNLRSYGYRSFKVCAPKLWNSLPFYIKSSPLVDFFKRRLKTFLFKKAFS